MVPHLTEIRARIRAVARPPGPRGPTLVALVALAGLYGAACDAGRSDDASGAGSPADTAATAATAAEADAVPGTLSAAERAAICDTINNSFRCARAIEAAQLPTAERAVRRGDTLLLATVTGDTIRLADEGGDHPDLVRWSYQEHWRDRGWFVVHKQYYEGSGYVLIDDSTANRVAVPDRPIPAPGGRRFAVLSLDLVAGYSPNTVQMWRFPDERRRPPELENEFKPQRWGGIDGSWSDSLTLRFTQHGYCDALDAAVPDQPRAMCDRPAVLTRESGSWDLETGKAVRDG